MPPRPLPSEAELAILTVLWDRGPATVRDVHQALRARQTGYTTVLKLLQIMHGKKLVTRDDSERSHVYTAAVPRERTKRRLVTDLAERAFGGSGYRLALHALEAAPASDEELTEIRELLDRLEAERRR